MERTQNLQSHQCAAKRHADFQFRCCYSTVEAVEPFLRNMAPRLCRRAGCASVAFRQVCWADCLNGVTHVAQLATRRSNVPRGSHVGAACHTLPTFLPPAGIANKNNQCTPQGLATRRCKFQKHGRRSRPHVSEFQVLVKPLETWTREPGPCF